MSTAVIAADHVRWFDQIDISQVSLVGGKNASLGEMYQALAQFGIRVPNGFAITAAAYRAFVEHNRLEDRISQLLEGLDTHNVVDLRTRGAEIRRIIDEGDFPPELREAIVGAYFDLGGRQETPIDVAVRSSATAEDLPDASFAGQQETYLNVQGNQALLDAVRRCFASLFTDRAISYRVDKGFDHHSVALSVGVQQMVRSDRATSGVMFTIDTETGFPDVVLINAAYGLGETVVKGTVSPDEFYVYKPTLRTGHRPILRKRLGSKESMMVYDTGGSRMTRVEPVSQDARSRFCITDDDVLQLAHWACMIEDHYSTKKGSACPMDIEWAKDGRTGELFVVQARPETVQSLTARDVIESFRLTEHSEKLVAGRAIGNRIGTGRVRIIEDASDLHEFNDGEVLVTDKTDPDWEPLMKKAAAIVTNRGGRTCHAAIVSRELGVPAIVGAVEATRKLTQGQAVTVCCAEGETGVVYDGELPFELRHTRVDDVPRPRTKIMMNVANPEEAFSQSMIPNDGVGLARVEFIINNHIKTHPMALIRFDELEDEDEAKEIERLTAGYSDKSDFFVDQLAQGVAMIAAAFNPRPVVVRMSDFKTNEYANLIGGRQFEPLEENPMIGFRGASRYYDDRYREAFGLECQAMKKVREDMGLRNVKLMIPFCRSVDEGQRVLDVMAEHGLCRGEDGLKVYVMCELPSNVFEADAFARIFDGFSIGSNDLTQLVLGVDRDSEVISHLFNERDAAVLRAVRMAIDAAKLSGRKIGICGQAPSDFPDFAAFLVEQGIDSMSLNPDAVLPTTLSVDALEEELARKQSSVEEHSECGTDVTRDI